jgi:hypothetical protein
VLAGLLQRPDEIRQLALGTPEQDQTQVIIAGLAARIDVRDERMGCGRVAAHFFRRRRRRGLENVGVNAGAVRHALGAALVSNHADRPFQRVAKGAPPGRTGIVREVRLALAAVNEVEGGNRKLWRGVAVQIGIPMLTVLEPPVNHKNPPGRVPASLLVEGHTVPSIEATTEPHPERPLR